MFHLTDKLARWQDRARGGVAAAVLILKPCKRSARSPGYRGHILNGLVRRIFLLVHRTPCIIRVLNVDSVVIVNGVNVYDHR